MHGILDIFLGFDVTTVITLPPILIHSRVAYAQYLLMRLYIATTATTNTYGAFLDPESLRIDDYLQRLIELQITITAMDERCGAARVLGASPRMREWYLNYKTTYVDHILPGQCALNDEMHMPDAQLSWYAIGAEPAFSFGLEELFADIHSGYDPGYAGQSGVPSGYV